MREAQVAEMVPDKKKNAAVLNLIFVRRFIGTDSMGAKVAPGELNNLISFYRVHFKLSLLSLKVFVIVNLA